MLHNSCGLMSEPQLNEFLATYFAECQDKLGFTPNVLRGYAFSRTKLRAIIDMMDGLMLGESGLDKLEREMISAAFSAVTPCYCCLTTHGAAFRKHSGDPAKGKIIAQDCRHGSTMSAMCAHRCSNRPSCWTCFDALARNCMKL